MALVSGALLAYWAGAPAVRETRAEPAHAAWSAACSCDDELRRLLQVSADLEWFKLAAVGLLCLAVAALSLLVGLVAALAGCCGLCCGGCLAASGRRPDRDDPDAGRGAGGRTPVRSQLLAQLADQEVRR